MVTPYALARHPPHTSRCSHTPHFPFSLSKSEHVTIRIYTSTGQLVRTLDLGQRASGAYLSKDKAAYWDGRNEKDEPVASGVFFYVMAMEAGESTEPRKMVVAR